jgi:uncharacterized protein
VPRHPARGGRTPRTSRVPHRDTGQVLTTLSSLDIPGWGWALLALAAAVAGMSKTLLPGAATLSVALFAMVLPAKISTGALLPLLIVGDMFALAAYRGSADLKTLRGLIPNVLLGLLVGAGFLFVAGDDSVRRVIGVILLVMLALTVWRNGAGRRARPAPAGDASEPTSEPQPERRRGIPAPVYGVMGGFTTMVANAGGPVMSMYFLASRFDVKTFLGTSALFFAVVNIIKVPFLAGLGLINGSTLALDAVLVLALVAGALVGRIVAGRISVRVFNALVVALTALSAVYLLL